MRLVGHPPTPEQQEIQRYRAGGFTISGREFHGSVAVFADRVEVWAVADAASLESRDLTPFRDCEPPLDLLLLGLGERFALPDPEVLRALSAWRLPYELMSTAAACRTFNLLLSEGRRVAAALIALPRGGDRR